MPSPDRRRRLLLTISALAMVVHLVGLYWPGSDGPGFDLPGLDKLVHVLLFAAPVWLLGRLTGRVWLVATGFAIHGAVSELIQHWFLPRRSGDPWDLVADLVGVAAATALLLARRGRDRRSAVAP